MRRIITVNDRMQKGYRYELVAPVGRNFDPEFDPDLSPKEMLRLGVFGGRYMTDCQREFPQSWFFGAKLSPDRSDPSLNYFGVNASQPLAEWQQGGYFLTIHEAGSSGTADITWEGACRRRTHGKSSAGRPCVATLVSFSSFVRPAISHAADDSGKPYCTGLTTAGSSSPRCNHSLA